MRGPNEYQEPMAYPEGGWAGIGQGNVLSLGWETILEGGWTTVDQRHEDVERKREYYHIIIFPEHKEENKRKP